MARILLYGATGRTGKLVLNYALEKGYDVTALVRDAAEVCLQSNHLTVVQGLTTNVDDVKKAMAGCDIVINTLGVLHQSEMFSFKKIEQKHTVEISIKNTLECMMAAGIRRIVSQSTFGAGDSYRFAPWLMRLAIKYSRFGIVYHDHNAQEHLIMKSAMDWTIARPVGLTNDEEIRQLCATYDTPPTHNTISRKHVAKFMVDCLENKFFLHKAPVISEK